MSSAPKRLYPSPKEIARRSRRASRIIFGRPGLGRKTSFKDRRAEALKKKGRQSVDVDEE